jgi:hypothetical protein
MKPPDARHFVTMTAWRLLPPSPTSIVETLGYGIRLHLLFKNMYNELALEESKSFTIMA